MKYRYKIFYMNERERWIYIKSDDDFDLYEPDAFVFLTKWILSEVNGTIKEIGYIQYQIDGDGIGLTYQWDDLFGTVIIYPEGCKNEALQFLKPYVSEF